MQISLDTNIWIFGILGIDRFCERILLNLSRFDVILPDQVREELSRNLSNEDMKQFYRFVYEYDVRLDFERVPQEYISEFEQKGLKKGDAEIGAFCEWRGIDVFVSDNRHFLHALHGEHRFHVMSPQAFCEIWRHER